MFDDLVDYNLLYHHVRVISIFERSRMFLEQRLLYCTKITNKNKKTFLKMKKEVGMLLPKRANNATSGVYSEK